MAKRLNVNISDEVADALERMATEEDVTVSEVVRRSISTEAFLREAQSRGEKLLILDPATQQMREIVFR